MKSIRSILSGPAETKLTTLSRVKAELSISNNENDVILGEKIDEATSDIEAKLRRTLCRVTLQETFWEVGMAESLLLDRWPVASVTSVTVDDVALSASEYRLNGDAGILYRLDSTGYPMSWCAAKSVIVLYAGGYLLPGETGRNLEKALEGACVDLVSSYWFARGRDPLIKSENVPGLGSVEYWVGAVGEAGELPPSVMSKISPFRRPSP